MPVQQIKLGDISKIDYMILPDNQRKTMKQMYDYLKGLNKLPDFIINGTMYSMSGTDAGITIANSIDEGKFINGGNFSPYGIAITDNKTLSFMHTSDARKEANKVRDFIGAAPTLVINSKFDMDTTGLSTSFYNDKKMRSFIGFNSDKLFLGCTSDPLTCKDLATVCLNYGMAFAINLDGGGSSTLGKIVDGKLQVIFQPSSQRANANWILVYLNKEESTPEPEPEPIDPASPENIIASGLVGLRINNKPVKSELKILDNKLIATLDLTSLSKDFKITRYFNDINLE